MGFFFFIFFRAAPEVYGGSQAGVKSELQLPAYTMVTATAGSEPHLPQLMAKPDP